MNPDALRNTDLRDGIPATLWAGANQAARDLLLAEHQRQRAEAARERQATDARRQELLRRILARPVPATEPTARLRALLLETAAAARALAMTLPGDGPSPDADASLTEEPK